MTQKEEEKEERKKEGESSGVKERRSRDQLEEGLLPSLLHLLLEIFFTGVEAFFQSSLRVLDPTSSTCAIFPLPW